MAPDTDDTLTGENAAPQADESSAPLSPGLKVELDIEDAPFLEDEQEEAPPQQQPEPETLPEAPVTKKEEEEKPQGKLAALLANKKRLIIIGGGALLLLILLPLGIMLLRGGKSAPPPVEPTRVIAPDAPPRPDAPAGPKFLFQAEPFFMERRGSEGEIRFLRCRFSIPTENPVLFAELQVKNIAVRDAIYYYLNNRPLTFLADAKSHEALKKDLISVINEHLSSEKIQELFIEEYLVTGR